MCSTRMSLAFLPAPEKNAAARGQGSRSHGASKDSRIVNEIAPCKHFVAASILARQSLLCNHRCASLTLAAVSLAEHRTRLSYGLKHQSKVVINRYLGCSDYK